MNQDNIFLNYEPKSINIHHLHFGEVLDLNGISKRKEEADRFDWEEIGALVNIKLPTKEQIEGPIEIFRADWDVGYRSDLGLNDNIGKVVAKYQGVMSGSEIQQHLDEALVDNIVPNLVNYITGVGKDRESLNANAALTIALYKLIENHSFDNKGIVKFAKMQIDPVLEKKFTDIMSGKEDNYVKNVKRFREYKDEAVGRDETTREMISPVGRILGQSYVQNDFETAAKVILASTYLVNRALTYDKR